MDPGPSRRRELVDRAGGQRVGDSALHECHGNYPRGRVDAGKRNPGRYGVDVHDERGRGEFSGVRNAETGDESTVVTFLLPLSTLDFFHHRMDI